MALGGGAKESNLLFCRIPNAAKIIKIKDATPGILENEVKKQ